MRSPAKRVSSVALVAVLAALTAGCGGGGSSANASTAPLTTLGSVRAPAPLGPPGPEGPPLEHGQPLAPPAAPAPGAAVDGIQCQGAEQVLFHIHARLTIFVRGVSVQVPAGVGIGPPQEIEQTPRGAFIGGGSCFAWLHTHAADGIIHIESPVKRTYTLGNFFDVWHQPLSATRVGPARGNVTALDDGKVWKGSPRAIPLDAHAQIQLEVGKPLVGPVRITKWYGL